jgi:LPS-assembly protein
MQFGDALSIFSDRAFRKDGGNIFEAVGNVVVVSERDTLYGESATFDRRTMTFKVEGNVRFVTQELTLYGSRLEYHATGGYAEIDNARITHPQFNLVARKIIRRAPKIIEATEAEFTTCRDCTESWAIYGRQVVIYLDDKVEISHGLLKAKGVSVVYLPYMVVPLSKRKTGLLFPLPSSRDGEGLSLQQPFFWAIDTNKDMTVTPSFWGTRGYGSDLEYRHRFGPDRWLTTQSRLLNDSIYLPSRTAESESGKNYTRYFATFENHWMWSPNWSHHLRYTTTRDLDITRDHRQYVEPENISSDFGLNGFVDGRGDNWSLSLQTDYLRNQLSSVADEFDRAYVQTLPRLAVGTSPQTLLQTDVPMFRHIVFGADGSFTRYRRVDTEDSIVQRDVDRVTANPYLLWQFFSWGPLSVKSEARFDFQKYHLMEVDQPEGAYAEKNATMLKTEASFTMDRIFGLAYEERIPSKAISPEVLKALKQETGQSVGPKPLTRTVKRRKMVGKLPSFEGSLTDEEVPIARHAYRHSQEYKFIHHFITAENESGNKDFVNQLQTNTGWFDYADAIRSQEYLLGANTTRTVVPPSNTLEFQWNNVLIKKSPRATDWRVDQRYLRDNFSYQRLGYFNVSQGYLFDEELSDLSDRLTRLAIQTGYETRRWSLTASEYFLHSNSQHLFQLAWQREFDFLNFVTAYNYNSFDESKLNTLAAGVQIRPTDVIGVSYVRHIDLEENEDIKTIYGIDLMPNNNCWILSLAREEALGVTRHSANVIFNFGQDRFSQYRRDWFRVKRF